MRVMVDENIPRMTVRMLRQVGCDVRDCRGTDQEGMSDESLWSLGQREQRLLISTAKGFARRRCEPHFGILVVCLKQPNGQRLHERIMQALEQGPDGEWAGRLVVGRDRVMSTWRAD